MISTESPHLIGSIGTPEFPALSVEDARDIVSRVERLSGICVHEGKVDFIRLRLSARLRELNLNSFSAYLNLLSTDTSGHEEKRLVESLTTHTTSFFREARHYDWLRDEGLAFLTAKSKRDPLVVWSAACSIGAELYSAGMLLKEMSESGRSIPRVQLIGTDISEEILRRAACATYLEEEIAGLSQQRMQRFMWRSKKPLGRGGGVLYRLVPELRENVHFERANLQNLNSVSAFQADIVFLRNVLIYFSSSVQKQVVQNVIQRMSPGAVLFTGHAEPLSDNQALRQLRPTIYQKI
ncbi:MAG: protein-glutamate O-methyltransferase CheR [Pelagimonas sp.]|nr:protein-glutamate O-methyltransferase CheR [Pelagimonas sp.]